MKRKSDHPLQKVTLNLYAGDFERICELYPRLGGSAAIREIVRNKIIEIESKAENIAPKPNLEINDV